MDDRQEFDPLKMTVNARTLWLISRVTRLEEMLLGMADVQTMLIATLSEQQKKDLRAALTEAAMTLPPGTLRTQPIWRAIGLLGDDDDSESDA